MSNNIQDKKDFELLSHTADLKIRVYGKSLEELFRNALIGMFQVIKPRAKICRYEHERLVCERLDKSHEINIESHDINSLLVDFLSQAIALSDIHNEAYLDVTITTLTDNQLKAIVKGISVDGFEVVEIKAATFHDLDIKKINGIWQTNIVFDI